MFQQALFIIPTIFLLCYRKPTTMKPLIQTDEIKHISLSFVPSLVVFHTGF